MRLNFALMRHAKIGGDDGVHPDSYKHLKWMAEGFSNYHTDRFIKVFHSPLKQARLTAEALVDILLGPNRSIQFRMGGPLDWLACDSFAISDENIGPMCAEDGFFTVFITHKPDMYTYMRKSVAVHMPIGHCAMWSPAGFTIHGH